MQVVLFGGYLVPHYNPFNSIMTCVACMWGRHLQGKVQKAMYQQESHIPTCHANSWLLNDKLYQILLFNWHQTYSPKLLQIALSDRLFLSHPVSSDLPVETEWTHLFSIFAHPELLKFCGINQCAKRTFNTHHLFYNIWITLCNLIFLCVMGWAQFIWT